MVAQNSGKRYEYQPYYCEENVWRLLQRRDIPADECHAVVITNAIKCVLIWSQRLSDDESGVAYWDYHVILVRKQSLNALVYDLDSVLFFPVGFTTYVDMTLRQSLEYPGKYHPRFRIIDGETYAKKFHSDRSHMRNNNGWIAPPPKWPLIKPQKPYFTLKEMINF